MTKAKPYRGKYPTRINTVASVNGLSGVLVILNNGTKYIVRPISPAGRAHMPKTGECFTSLRADDYSSAPFYAPTPCTELEYQTALELSRDANTSEEHAAQYWQLCRQYRGQIFNRGDAEKALAMLRTVHQ